MKQILIVIIFILFRFSTFAFEYKKYNALINKAEIAITEGKFDNALVSYDSAFAMRKTPFAQDLFNASVCAVNLRDNGRAIYYCRRLARKGVGSDFFTKNNVYLPLHTSADWKTIIGYAAIARDSMLTATKNLRLTVDSLLAVYDKNEDARKKTDISSQERAYIKLTRDSFFLQFYGLLDKNHFLNENMIGPSLDKDGNLTDNPVFQRILNITKNAIADSLHARALTNALKKGDIRAVYYVNTIGSVSSNEVRTHNYGVGLFKNYQCTIYTTKNAIKDSALINQKRQAIGFGSMDDELKKIAYRVADPESAFRFGTKFLVVIDIGKEFNEMVDVNYDTIVKEIPGCTYLPKLKSTQRR